MKKIVIINYGLVIVVSIKNMLARLGFASVITSDKSDIAAAGKIILPGVGAFDHGIRQLNQQDLIHVLEQKVLKDNTPILGICLGMQLLTKCSEEGTCPGLGWLEAETVRFRAGDFNELRIPHMGWNSVHIRKQSPLIKDLPARSRFYFAHSFHVVCQNTADILMESYYGLPFVSAIQHKNIFGVQFHPEKSHRFGMQLLKNFCEIKNYAENTSTSLSLTVPRRIG